VMRGRLAPLLAAATCLAACAGLGPQASSPTASISVELLTGAPPGRRFSASQAPESVHLIVDVTPSMELRTEHGVARLTGAKAAAAQLLASLPEDTSARVMALGHRPGLGCPPPETLGSAPESGVGVLSERIRELTPQSEDSVAGTLRVLAREFTARPAAAPARVVLFSDLGAECGGDLCEAASELAGAGARLDLVLLGEPALPACLASPLPVPGPGSDGPALSADAHPSFRVLRSAASGMPEGPELATGTAGRAAVDVEPGLVEVVVETNPPERIGPFRAHAGRVTRVRMLDFPGLRPPLREWRVE
jgi:hypothetical protein